MYAIRKLELENPATDQISWYNRPKHKMTYNV